MAKEHKTEQNTENTPETPPINLRCHFCGESVPVSEVMMIDRFFPPLVACKNCERILG